MKKQNNVGKMAGLVAIVALGASTNALGAIVDLSVLNSSGVIEGATFQQINQSTTGTGNIQSFLRINKDTAEAAYNTSGNLQNPFNQLGGNSFNKDLLLSSVPVVNGSYQFLLDVNQLDNSALLSLNQLQVFQTTTPGQTAGSVDATTGRLITTGLAALTSVYDMNPNGVGFETENSVTINYALNPGSGKGDMFLYIPTSFFTANAGNYVLLYSQFGTPGANESNDGFEEWATFTPVPEPTTMIAGLLLLLPFAASTVRFMRKRTAA